MYATCIFILHFILFILSFLFFSLQMVCPQQSGYIFVLSSWLSMCVPGGQRMKDTGHLKLIEN